MADSTSPRLRFEDDPIADNTSPRLRFDESSLEDGREKGTRLQSKDRKCLCPRLSLKLKDNRQAVKPKTGQPPSPQLLPLSPPMSSTDLDQFVLSPGGAHRRPSLRMGKEQTGSSDPALDIRSWSDACGCLSGMWSLVTGRDELGASKKGKEKEAPRRWYRVHPITDELYYVRPDAGVAGRAFGHPDAGLLSFDLSVDSDMASDSEVAVVQDQGNLVDFTEGEGEVESIVKRSMKKRASVPRQIDRMVGLGEPGFNDTFVNLCKLCYDSEADIVLLPCRHGGFCEACLRKCLFSKPVNKGGNSCPWCRKKIIEVIKIYGDSAINMYGYAISAGCFFLGKDDT